MSLSRLCAIDLITFNSILLPDTKHSCVNNQLILSLQIIHITLKVNAKLTATKN